ncbi:MULTISPECIES: Pr6Pr family membrane protein [unclassified Microbacterium]|uniref:Pr6Pr family membrane protein n=1 Tax=unclassified Microbacterium TaxID=2609290 RepID=UPI0036548054
MTPRPASRLGMQGVGAARLVLGAAIITILMLTYVRGGADNGYNPFDYFGFFTNLTSLLAAIILILVGARGMTARGAHGWLTDARAVATACMLLVAVIYNGLVPGTGSAPPWVSVTLHIVFPSVMALDWLIIGDRGPMPWPRFWILAPYPVLWLIVVLARGATDGWVPYGFLLPERGAGAIALTALGLLGALGVAGALVWWASRLPGMLGARSETMRQ